MGFKINDRVEHETFGKGTVVEICGEDNYLVQFDVPNSSLHSGNGYSANRYKDNTCYYCFASKLKLLNVKNSESLINKSKVTVLLPERYIINENACILFWKNGEKTVVKKCADDEFCPRLAFLTAFFQHYVDMSKNKANKYLANLQVEPEPKQKPKHMKEETKFKFKVGQELIDNNGNKVTILKIDKISTYLPYYAKNEEGFANWYSEEQLKPIKEGK